MPNEPPSLRKQHCSTCEAPSRAKHRIRGDCAVICGSPCVHYRTEILRNLCPFLSMIGDSREALSEHHNSHAGGIGTPAVSERTCSDRHRSVRSAESLETPRDFSFVRPSRWASRGLSTPGAACSENYAVARMVWASSPSRAWRKSPGAGRTFPRCRAKRITSALIDEQPRPHETCEKILRTKRATAQNRSDILGNIS